MKGFGFYMLHNTLLTNGTQMVPDARGLAMALFAFSLFIGQYFGVALGGPVLDAWGARPIFLFAAAVVVAVTFWFLAHLVRRET